MSVCYFKITGHVFSCITCTCVCTLCVKQDRLENFRVKNVSVTLLLLFPQGESGNDGFPGPMVSISGPELLKKILGFKF